SSPAWGSSPPAAGCAGASWRRGTRPSIPPASSPSSGAAWRGRGGGCGGRAAAARRVLRPLRGERPPAAAWRGFLAYARREPRLVLARYLFTPREVAERILGQLRSSRGVEHPFTSGREVVHAETARFLAALPAYEAAILDHLTAGAAVRWIGDGTPEEVGGLVEAPLGTVVVVARPPGSDWEFEWKRCGRRGDHPLRVVFRPRGPGPAPRARASPRRRRGRAGPAPPLRGRQGGPLPGGGAVPPLAGGAPPPRGGGRGAAD